MDWIAIAEKSNRNEELTREEAQSVLNEKDENILSLIHAAYKVRKKSFGNKVKINFLLNAKSGLCPEDCNYCSQSKDSSAEIDKYPFQKSEEIIAAAERAKKHHASRICIVNSGRGPTDGEVNELCDAVENLKKEHKDMEVCVCLGLLKSGQAEKLKNSGVHAYNHNLNTSVNYYSSICSTHSYQDRVETVEKSQEAGLSSCSGCLFGMGEKDNDIVDLAFTLRKMKVDSIPLNFLIPIDGTPLSETKNLTPQKCLKILCLFRFVNPTSELRIAGGREVHLRSLQPLGLYVANSIFIGDYLTTKGQKPEADLGMIKDMGFEILGEDSSSKTKETRPQKVATPEEYTVRLK